MKRLSVIAVGLLLSLCLALSCAQTMPNVTVTLTAVPCRVRNCATCLTGSGGVICRTCNTGYRTNTAGLCVLSCRVTSCSVCFLSDNTKCATCASGYGRNSQYLCVRRNTGGTIVIISGTKAPLSLITAAVVTAAALVVMAL